MGVLSLCCIFGENFMLINNVSTERRASLIVKNSAFYIEIAKFVQAYTTIVKNPNEFLQEINQPHIDKKTQHLTWEQLVEIMQKCDLGFEKKPTEMELVVYYNYALEIGSLDSVEKKIASISQVADAQKHYYNFVDEATDRAKNEYLKQHRIAESRAREMSAVDNKLTSLAAVKGLAFVLQMLGVFCLTFGLVSFFANNAVVSAIGGIFGFWKPQFLGAIVLTIVGIVLFAIFDKIFLKFKLQHLKLKQATVTIFERTDDSILEEKFLKKKLDELTRQLKIVQAEINDKKQRFDVKHNIEQLKATNKYYKRLCENEEEFVASASEYVGAERTLTDDDFAPVKLTKEQSENLLTVSKEAINLEGQFDEEAYNEKFEKSRIQEKPEDEKDAQTEEHEAIENLENQEKELLESIDYIKEILGFAENESVEEHDKQKEQEKELEDILKEK